LLFHLAPIALGYLLLSWHVLRKVDGKRGHVSSRFCVDARRTVFVSGVRPYEELYIEPFEFICGSANTRPQRMTVRNCGVC
jgi:hypothetical protein